MSKELGVGDFAVLHDNNSHVAIDGYAPMTALVDPTVDSILATFEHEHDAEGYAAIRAEQAPGSRFLVARIIKVFES